MNILRRKARNFRIFFATVSRLFREEVMFAALALSGVCTLIVSFLLRLSYVEWLVVVLVIGCVLSTEMLNTAIEELCDHVTPEEHPHVGKIKDIAMTASAFINIVALIIGLMIFMPHLAALL